MPSLSNQGAELPPPALVSEGRHKPLMYIDVIFGGYCVALVLVALVAWLQNMGNVWSGVILAAFAAVNAAISLLSLRSAKPLRVEVGRAIVGAVIAPAAYLLVGAPFSRWWPGFLIMCLGGNVIVGLLTGSPRWGRLLVVYYIVLLSLTEALTPPPHNWYDFAISLGTVALVGLVFAEVVSLLGMTLAAEREQRRQLALEKAKSETMLQQEATEALRESEERFRTLVETSADGIALISPEGKVKYISPAYERLSGYTAAELIGQTIFAVVHPDDLAQASQVFASAIQNPGQVVSLEYRQICKDGEIRIMEGGGKQLSNGDLVGYVRDITGRKQAEEALRRLNEELEQRVEERTAESKRLATIIEATTDLVGIADMQGHMSYINRAGRRMLGYGEHEDLSRFTMADIYPPHALAHILNESVPTGLAQGGVTSFETVIQHRDGHEIPVSGVGVAHFTPKGELRYLSAILRDITEHKQAEAQLRQAKEAAEAANKAKSTFLANMSHEIRTPMNAVIGMTSLLLNTLLNDKQRDFVETIRVSGDALLTIINDILDFSKIEAGKMELVNRPLDLRDCLETTLDLLSARASEKGLDLAYTMDASVPGAIVGDVTRLRQILVNLISNAIKFTEKGEVVVTVNSEQSSVISEKLTDHRSPITVHFSVRDSGIGVPPDKIDRLFQSFSPIDPSTTREYGGTGLGLAISKRLAELMGGTMWVESEGVPGKGSAFHFTLVAEEAPVRAHLQSRQPVLAGKRILIVDDHPTNRRILSLQTQTWGMIPQEAATPSQALDTLRRSDPFDLVILDMHLPEMDGVALAEQICQLGGAQRLPLVMLTSAGYEGRAESIDCFAAYLTKPVRQSQLYDVLVGIFAGESVTAQPAPATEPQAEHGALAERLPLRILLAEDVAVNQKFALLALEDMGYRADIAANGLEVQEAVRRQPYDVVLMDVQMPEMDGLEATRRIHQMWGSGLVGLPTARRPYIIAMTANALQGDREICLAAGMDDYISKPVYLAELRAALGRAGASRTPNQAHLAPPTPQGNGSQASIDYMGVAKLLKRRNGGEIITLFIEEAQGILASLRSAVGRGDPAAVQEVAHSLKGSSSYVDAQRVAALSAELEQVAKSGSVDGAVRLLAQLEQAFAQAREALEAEVRR